MSQNYILQRSERNMDITLEKQQKEKEDEKMSAKESDKMLDHSSAEKSLQLLAGQSEDARDANQLMDSKKVFSSDTDTVNEDEQQLSLQMKIFQTIVIYIAYFTAGMNYSIQCQLLVYIEDYTGTNTKQVSAIFSWRGVGYAVGNVVSGILFDRINPFIVMGYACFGSAAFHFIIPLYDDILIVYILAGFHAFFLGHFPVGAALIILRLWKAKSGPLIVGYMLTYTFAGIVSAWIIKVMAESLLGEYSLDVQDVSENITESSDFLLTQNISLNITSVGTKDIAYSVILYSYLMNGFIQILAGTLCVVVTICIYFRSRSVEISGGQMLLFACKNIQSKYKNTQSKVQLSAIKKLCVFLFTLLTTFQLMLEMGYAGLLVSFIVDHLKWTKSEAMVMSSVLFLSNTVGKVLAIPLTKFIAPAKLLGATLVVNTVMVFMLSALVDLDISIVWICTILSGAMSAIQLPTLLTWASTIVPISGKIASVLAGLPYAIVMMVGILAVGFVMDECGPMFYSYSMAIYVLITNVLFVLTWYCARVSKREKKKREIDITEKDPVHVTLRNNKASSLLDVNLSNWSLHAATK